MTYNDLAHLQFRPCPLKGVIVTLTLTLPPKGVVKGQPPNIAMFAIKLKVLMSILTIDVYELHLNVKLLKGIHTVF